MRHQSDNSIPHGAFRKPRLGVRVFVRRLPALLCLFALPYFCGATSSGQEIVDARKEYNVKAVTLYAFGRYVTWPNSVFEKSDSPFVIGLLGENPFGDALDQIAAKKAIAGRSISVRQFNSPDECAACHILFVTGTGPPEMEAKRRAKKF